MNRLGGSAFDLCVMIPLLALSNSDEIYGNDDSVDCRRITDAFPVRPGPALLCPTLHGNGASSEGHSNSKDRDAHGMGGRVSHGLGLFIDYMSTGSSSIRIRLWHRELGCIHV